MTDEEIDYAFIRRLQEISAKWPDEVKQRLTMLREGGASLAIFAYIEAIARDPVLMRSLQRRAAEIASAKEDNS